MPKTNTPTMTRVVMTGRGMKRRGIENADVDTVSLLWRVPRRAGWLEHAGKSAAEPRLELVEIGVEDRRHVQRHDLRDREPADDHDPESLA